MNHIVTIRDNSSTKLPGELRNGKAWSYDADGKFVPVIDGQSDAAKAFGIDALVKLLTAGRYDQIPSDCQADAGENASGLIVMDAADYNAKKQTRRDNSQPCPHCGTYCDGDCQAHKN